MIIPWFFGFRDFSRAPLTWAIGGLCVILFFVTFNPEPLDHHPLLEARSLRFTGALYLQYQFEDEFPPPTELMFLGGKALRDPEFLADAADYPFAGDSEEIAQWRKALADFRKKSESRAVFQYGFLKPAMNQPLRWLTYQFTHADLPHLLGNLVFLFLFGVAVETIRGSFWVALTYLGGGLAGALFALLTDPPTISPMVGASASISALMSFYMIIEAKRRVRFFYFFSPLPNFYGDVFMSKWWIAPLCLLPDLGNWLAERWVPQSELIVSPIATSAHIGGTLFGLVLGVMVRYVFRFRERPREWAY
ncbi:MAG: rhomboid family intramembrane serine protease [Bdellovibrio sp.]|nr:MAG: rhomboid family intramembrane serine protease [Bdellovibrio sp.]